MVRRRFLRQKNSDVSRYKNTPEGRSQFIQEIRSRAKKACVCMEHTGGLETPLAIACNDAKFIVSIVDGKQISDYRKSFGAAKAKTDVKDAQLIARFCKDRKPAQWLPMPDHYRTLRELVKFREDLIAQRTMVINQDRRGVHCEFVSAQRETLFQLLDAQIQETDKEIQKHLDASKELKDDVERLVSIPGIAIVSAVKILAETGPVSGYDTAKDYAMAAGLAPVVFQSGKKTPPGRLIVYGNRKLRSALYFPTVVNLRNLTAKKPNAIAQFMKRIQSNGPKAKMTVIVAGMRKLAHIIFGVLKHRTLYNPEKV